jgi:hypothetical protein
MFERNMSPPSPEYAKQETSTKQEASTFLQNIDWLSMDYTAL